MPCAMPPSFFNPNHNYCIAKTGYLADKIDPLAPNREYSMIGSRLTGGAMLQWPIAYEFHNSVQALFSPFLGWVAYNFLEIK